MLLERFYLRAGAFALAVLCLCAAPPLAAQALLDRFTMAVVNDRADDVAAMLARGVDPNTVDAN